MIHTDKTRSSATADMTRDAAIQGHSRSFKVIHCYANRRGIYDFLLILNSNFTSIFNRSWDITPSCQIHTHHVKLEKDGWQ